jgi:hypothetical protein
MLRARWLATVATLLFPLVVGAQSFVGSEYGGGAMYQIDRATGNFTTLCDPSTGLLPGLAFNPNTNTLYGVDETNLYTVNRTTCVATLVGPTGHQVTGLTFNTTFTTLYSIGYDGNLYSINPATGTATSIGAMGVASPGLGVTDLATRSDGAVFSAGVDNNLYSVNVATGAFTSLGAITGTGGGGLTAIAFDNLDVLYGINTSTDRLMIVDTTTLAATDVGTAAVGSDVRGLAFVGNVAAASLNIPVPALDTLGLLLLMGVVGVMGVVAIRRA